MRRTYDESRFSSSSTRVFLFPFFIKKIKLRNFAVSALDLVKKKCKSVLVFLFPRVVDLSFLVYSSLSGSFHDLIFRLSCRHLYHVTRRGPCLWYAISRIYEFFFCFLDCIYASAILLVERRVVFLFLLFYISNSKKNLDLVYVEVFWPVSSIVLLMKTYACLHWKIVLSCGCRFMCEL